MRFEFVALRDFRNLCDGRRSFDPGLNVIVGPNGAGKTNLLEALAIAAGWGPLSAQSGSGRVRGTVAWGSASGWAMTGGKTSGEEEHEVVVRLSSRMTPRVDGHGVSCTDLRLLLPSIVFLPTDIGLVDGAPPARRSFIDRLCALCYPPYARRLSEFRQVSRHRTALLRHGKLPDVTSIPFASLGGWIMEARRVLVSHLLELSGDAGFSLAMLPEFEGSGAEYLMSALEENAEREAHALRPLAGPGRDDLRIEITGGASGKPRPASGCLSRGQKRKLVLSLIIMAGNLIESRLRKKPVLLFDDLSAELDAENRRRAGEMLSATGWQVFVTGTDDPFPGLAKAVHVLRP